MQNKVVSIVVPCYNEEDSLPHLYEEVKKIMAEIPGYKWELLFINDGSRDHTMSIIREMAVHDSRISYVDLSRNFGKENAMLAGFDYVKGDVYINDGGIVDEIGNIYKEQVKSIEHWPLWGFKAGDDAECAFNSLYVEMVISVFMLLFSVNFNLYYLLLIGRVKDVLKNEELRWFFTISIAVQFINSCREHY